MINMYRLISRAAQTICLSAAVIPNVGHAQASAESHYGCSGLELVDGLPTLEGKDGVFFRINLDIRMHHAFSDQSVGFVGELSRVLAENGTTLIFVPIPTKSVAMPDYLPPEAALYGFDVDVATAVHDDIINRLNEVGVITVDPRKAILAADTDERPFFQADFHWTPVGARATAQAIGELIKSLPEYADLPKTQFETVEGDVDIAFSGMRRELQENCIGTLPEAASVTYQTSPVESGDVVAGSLDLFGEEETTLPIALLGTSFSATQINNFPGFISQYSDLEVVNYALTGGNQFGAMSSYLTSEEFQEARPKILIWENPIYTNLSQFGDQPLRELIASAGNTCTVPLETVINEENNMMTVDLSSYDFGPDDTIFLDLQRAVGSKADFLFRSPEGLERLKSIVRGDRLKRTGRFYMPMSGLWPEGADTVEISAGVTFSTPPSVYACTTKSKEEI